MLFTPEQIAKMRQKNESLPEAKHRGSSVNYFEGYFFVTLNTRGERPILSTVLGHVGATGNDAPHCEYSDLGMEVLKCWNRCSEFSDHVETIACEAMPDHFHGLIKLLPGNKRHLGRIIGGFMIGCSHCYWDQLGIDWRSMGCNTRAIARQWQDSDHTRSFRGPALFVHGYNDVEPITEAEVQIKIEYIRKQAEKRLIQGDRHDCFSIHRNCHSDHWDTPVSYVGYSPILANPKKLPLVCHRADASRFEEQKQAVLCKAREGYVIVSAFISEKERDIKAELMAEQLPIIQVMDNGFSERYKPCGRDFYACAENRLVQVSCWEYQYHRESTLSREMCLKMNALACTICNSPDTWWKDNE